MRPRWGRFRFLDNSFWVLIGLNAKHAKIDKYRTTFEEGLLLKKTYRVFHNEKFKTRVMTSNLNQFTRLNKQVWIWSKLQVSDWKIHVSFPKIPFCLKSSLGFTIFRSGTRSRSTSQFSFFDRAADKSNKGHGVF